MTRLYPRMALTNIKNNSKTYIPYMLSTTITVTLFYIICSLCNNDDVSKLWGGNIIQSYMGFGQFVIAVFAVIFLFYVNSFLIKRRLGEFGLYNVLGMEKCHIARIVFWENFYVFFIAMALGFLLGIILDKLMYLIILNILNASIPLGFYISGRAIGLSLALFGVIFSLMFLNSLRLIYKTKPTELLKSDNMGEKEPKAKWILAILGIICLGTGYFIAVFTKNPVAAVMLFFVAVILVIIGTYLLFTAGSIALLKIMRKNKGYYYKTNHFISISSMMYRMKRNAIGLANICILSTMVLVMISVTLSMFIGVDDAFQKRYPSDYNVTSTYSDRSFDEAVTGIESGLEEQGLKTKNNVTYRTLSFSLAYDDEKEEFSSDIHNYSTADIITAINDINTFIFVTLDDYNKAMDTHEALKDGEILVHSTKNQLKDSSLDIFDQHFEVKKNLNSFMMNNNLVAQIASGHYVVAKDIAVLEKLCQYQTETYGKNAGTIQSNCFIDVAGNYEKNKDAMTDVYNSVQDSVYGSDSDMSTTLIECRAAEDDTFGVDFIALFFIGVFLGFLFIMATVLIIYYKQITEGYEDQKRFEILQNVGMSSKDVKKSINAQVLTVFFLPLIVAGVHIAFAFPFLYRIMALMNLYDLGLFATCTVGCFLVFALFYTLVYKGTAKLYYGIVKK
ncbi:MAG: ABC transporter permease [Clostridiales bacterium]|nr:ABC transporter permease [Clostridiales bacterium]